MAELIAPTARLHASWLESRDEWGHGVHQDGSGLRPGTEVESAAGFAAWVRQLTDQEDPAVPPQPGWVHCSYRWIVEDDRFLGSIALRHSLTDDLLAHGGHIGYGVRPSERERGLAGWALAQTLDRARAMGLSRVLITCDPANVPSRRTIERAGGVLEDVRGDGDHEVRRYWIAL
jgi:predicted acetyltransferase